MSKHIFTVLFFVGALVLLWVAYGFMAGHGLALAMTLLIAAVYGYGSWELQRFRQATATLQQALSSIPEGISDLGAWLCTVHPSLQNPVRLRIEGERVGLPGPALTPYLVGLLVMLGMLGTFLGMVVTLNGAVFALEGTSNLEAMRSAFATPIKGLGLAFGTSVAGVASSAMLGLLSALSRRERLHSAQLLDSKIAGALRGFSLVHQRQQAFLALQQQSLALPSVVAALQSLVQQIGSMGQQLGDSLSAKQERFHSEAKEAYSALARSVDQSLKDSLQHSTQAAGDSLRPVLHSAMLGIAEEARQMHERMLGTTQTQLEALGVRLHASTTNVTEGWAAALTRQEASSASLLGGVATSLQAFDTRFEHAAAALVTSVQQAYAGQQAEHSAEAQQRLHAFTSALDAMAAGLQREWQQAGAHTLAQQQQICEVLRQTAQDVAQSAQSSAGHTLAELQGLLDSSEALLRSRMAAEAQWTQTQGERMDQLINLLASELGALRTQEASRGLAAVERLGDLQTAVAGHLATLGTALEEPIRRLIETASEAPRAAAEVIGQLRQEVSSSVARDNELLEERARIMETLNTLLASIHHASQEQRAVIDALVGSTAEALQQASGSFTQQVGQEAGKLADVAAQVSSSAVEVSSLSDAFGFAVKSFGEANDKLIANLQRIEGAMDKSMARSDEQLAYYVAQAREIIDLSISSQKDMVDGLHQIVSRQSELSDASAEAA